MTRRLWLSLFAVLALACGESLPDSRQAAVHVQVSYDFKAGCIAVLAQDKAAPDKQVREQKEVLDRAPVEAGTRRREANFAVFRKDDWGRTVQITVTAHEQSCAGPEVANQVLETTLNKAGTQTLTVSLTAPDVDDDGYVATSASGTDCEDEFAGSNPGVKAEICDGHDNDCAGGVDNGLTLTDFFRDRDNDGVGAGATVKACSAPPNHVTTSNDCDDDSSARTPGKAEVCDEVDNDCDTTVDEGLPTSTFHPDSDGDGFGASAGGIQRCRAPMGYVAPTPTFDCNDTQAAVKPGAIEVCNQVDDNCVAGIDEGFTTSWYLDGDNDGFGRQNDMVQSCTQPGGRVAGTNGFDCDDTVNTVFPGATETCNNRDDNCVNGNDETFPNRGMACNNDVCTGTFICNTAGTATECNAPAPVPYYSDRDEDTEGSANPADMIKVCAPNVPPGGYVTSQTDCDDRDPYNRSNGTEVCDDRDNNCRAGKDEMNVCAGKGWKALTDVVATAHNWNTVAVGVGGYPVWLAGDSGELAIKISGSTPFIDLEQRCGTNRWRAAWVRPSDGQVFLAGDGGNLATYNGITPACTMASTTNATGGTQSNKHLHGIVGFEAGAVTTVYAVNDDGHVYAWTPGTQPVYKGKRPNPADPFFSIHGVSTSQLFTGGHLGGAPVLFSYDATGSNLVSQTLTGVASANSGHVLGVWAMSSTVAYAVGQKGLVLKWEGANTWSFASPDAAMVTDLTSVVALDDSSVYITDSVGKIRRPTAAGWVEHFTASGELRDIAVVSPQNIWAVGPSGRVVHFPETL
jgi:hypothetical protein